MSGKPKRKPRHVLALNTIEIAMSRARGISREDQEMQARNCQVALTDLQAGAQPGETQDQDRAFAAWRSLADAANMAESLAELRIGAGQDADRLIREAQAALHAVYERHQSTEVWSLDPDEHEALAWLLKLHALQLQECSYGEFERAFKRTADRVRQARAGNAAPGVIVTGEIGVRTETA